MPDLFAEDELPVGSILEWSGILANIPEDFHLCDGTNGTPNLIATFVRGAPASTEAGGTGGTDSVTLTQCQIPSHSHSVTDPKHNHGYGGAGDSTPASGSNNNSCNSKTTSTNSTGISLANAGGGGSHENRPAYYEVAFIMKIVDA